MKKMLKVAFALSALAIAIVFAGCDSLGEDPTAISKPGTSSTGVIKGKVIAQEGITDLSGIDIILEKLDDSNRSATITRAAFTGRSAAVYLASTVTEADGTYEFKNLSNGNYTIYAKRDNEAAIRSASIVDGGTVTVEDLKLVIKGSLSGTLKVTGASAAGSIVGVAGTSYIAFVDEDGKFTISGIPAGKYKLCVMTNGKYQTFPTEITVDGKKTANAGVLSVAIENSDNIKSVSYVTAYATDRGIYFSGSIPSNVYSQTSSSNINTNTYTNKTNAICSISICECETGITMHKDWTIGTDEYANWTMTYPLVDANKEYNFNVNVGWHNYTFYSQNIKITAKDGLGEFIIENKDDYKVELTADKVIQRTGKPKFTDNPNVLIKRQGIEYTLYSYKAKPDNFWNGEWVLGQCLYGDFDTFPVNDLYYVRGWGEDDPRLKLSGHTYGVRALTKIELAGYSDDDNIFFEMNDEKIEYGNWGGEKIDILEVFGWKFEDETSITDFIFKDKDGNVIKEITGLPGTKIGDYQYAKVHDILDTRYEPITLPKVITNNSLENYRFEKWTVTYPTGWSYSGTLDDNLVEIGGKKYLIQYVYAQFAPEVTLNIKFMMNDGTSKVYTTKKASTEKNPDVNSWPNWNQLSYFYRGLKEPERNGYKFTGWYFDKECTQEANNIYDLKKPEFDKDGNLPVYAGWAKNVSVTLKDGNKTIETVTSFVGDNTDSFVAPEKKDAIFDGWYSDADFTNSVYEISENTKVLYAKYLEVTTLYTADKTISEVSITSSVLDNLSVGDTLYFELQNTSTSLSGSTSLNVKDNYNNYIRSIYYSIVYGKLAKYTLSYTFTSSDTSLLNFIKNNGLKVTSGWDKVKINKICYLKASSTASDGE